MTKGLYQHAVDARIEYWKERYPQFISGRQAIREFTEFVFDADVHFSIAEVIDSTYSPSRAKLLFRELSNHRIHQLMQGAPLKDKEWDAWKNTIGELALNSQYLSVCQLADSDGTLVWFAVTMNGFHLTSSITDAAGPFWSHNEAILYCGTKIRSWFGWWMPIEKREEGERTKAEIEQISRKRCENYHTLAA